MSTTTTTTTTREHGTRRLAVITGSRTMIDAFSHALGSQLEDAGLSVTRVVSDLAGDLRVMVMAPAELPAYLAQHQRPS